MSPPVPPLQLSHGQVLWCLAGGQEPGPPLPAQVRYLRQSGIPFADAEHGAGRGVRISYNFYQFIELGVAYEALRQRMAPRLLQQLIDERPLFRNLYRHAYSELALHPELLDADPYVQHILGDELLIQLRDQYSDAPRKITLATPNPEVGRRFGDLVEAGTDGEELPVIPLKALTLRLLNLAKIAPETRPGPKG